jgi:putative tryptophan/tyrosine transport system substrate-binding protein
MRRREFIAGLGSAAAAWPVVARAQQRVMPVIGYIGGTLLPGATLTSFDKAFLKGLAEAGYVEGRNVAIEYRWVEERNERLPGFVDDLVGRRVAVIAVVISTAAALAAKAATQTIPIVFRIGGDPIAAGIVPNLNRPGGNITGITTLGSDLAAKRLEILREILPAEATVAYLTNSTNANTARLTVTMEAAAHQLGVRLVIFNTTTPDDIEAAFTSFSAQKIRGLMTAGDPLFFQYRYRLVALAARHAIPAIYSDRFFTEAAGLMSYGTDIHEGWRQAGIYTGRILSGEKPAGLPVQQSTKVELIINLKTAKALGLTIPTNLLVRADEVIEE